MERSEKVCFGEIVVGQVRNRGVPLLVVAVMMVAVVVVAELRWVGCGVEIG